MAVTVRELLKGLGDTFENLLAFTVVSLAWWLSVILVIPAPGAAIALLAVTDPRAIHSTARPGLLQSIPLTGYYLLRGWVILLLALPVLGVAALNLWFYRDERSALAALVPVWTVLLVFLAAITAITLSCMALFDDGVVSGLRRAVSIVVRRPLAVVLVLAALWGLLLVSMVLVVPLFMFFPALAGAVVNRFVLRTLGIAVPDPLEPSPERLIEEERARSARRFGP